MSKMKFGLKSFKGITPLKIRKLSLAINGACLTAIGYSAITENKVLSLSLLGVILVSQIVSELFEDDPDD